MAIREVVKQLKPAGANQTCSTCRHWHGNNLSVGKTRLVARCSELEDQTMADERCFEWTPRDGIILPKEPPKPLRHYNCWDKQEWTCEECGAKFVSPPSNKNGRSMPRRFCTDACYRKWQKEHPINEGCFKPGHVPANKGKKGIRVSPETEFKPGNIPPNTVPVGTCIERDQHNGSGRKQAYIKIAEPNKWKARALIVWEEHHGQLPEGMLLYHKDSDSLNDDIDNLEAITRAENLARMRANLNPAVKSRALKEAWKKRRQRENALRRMNVADLKRLGYTCYCPVCDLPHKTEQLKCHRNVEAVKL